MAASAPGGKFGDREEQEEELQVASADLEVLREGRQQERGRVQDVRRRRGFQQAEHGRDDFAHRALDHLFFQFILSCTVSIHFCSMKLCRNGAQLEHVLPTR